jgi:hypothetical protein
MPLDPEVLAADDLLLDALGRGEPAPVGDPLAGLLAAWRAELADGDTPEPELAATRFDRTADARRPGNAAAAHDADGAAEPGCGDSAAEFAPGRGDPATRPLPRPRSPRPGRPLRSGREAGRPRPTGPAGRSRPGRLGRRLGLSTVAALVTTALLGLGVSQAGPTSVFWPIATAVYPERSAVRAVEHSLTLAADAVRGGRYDEARRHLDEAAAQVTEVRDPLEAARLRARIDRLRRALPAVAEPDAAPRSSPAAPSGHPSSPGRGRPDPTPATPKGRSPTPRPSASSGPSVRPTPPRVLPLPVPVLPSLLPSGLPLLPSGGCLLLCPPD